MLTQISHFRPRQVLQLLLTELLAAVVFDYGAYVVVDAAVAADRLDFVRSSASLVVFSTFEKLVVAAVVVDYSGTDNCYYYYYYRAVCFLDLY